MDAFSTYQVLFVLCSIIILSYFFTVVHKATRIPSVLLLLGAGIVLGFVTRLWGLSFEVPAGVIEFLGTVGLIMIVLEAGLDLELNRSKIPLVKQALLSSGVLFVLSTAFVAVILKTWLSEAGWISCIVYAVPLSIASSAVIMPSVGHLGVEKKEFLIYEAAFSDILGVMAFNFLTAGATIGVQDVVWLGTSTVTALVLSVAVCFVLMWLLVRNRVHVKFFLSFAILIVTYVGGKMMHLPSLLTILMFGLIVNNWEVIRWKPLKAYFSDAEVENEASFLKSITLETSFLIRTFFFVLFGYGIDLSALGHTQAWQVGSLVVLALLVLRWVYLRIMNRYNLFPALFYIPRGLITVLLFYKIPAMHRIERFDEGILFFVILATSLILMVGAIFYRDRPLEEGE